MSAYKIRGSWEQCPNPCWLVKLKAVIIMPLSEPPSALIDKDSHSKFHGSHLAQTLAVAQAGFVCVSLLKTNV